MEDHERWTSETVQQQQRTSTDDEPCYSRYSRDMAQARRMMGETISGSRSDNCRDDEQNTNAAETDVDAGMKGLERAKKYNIQGDYEKALKLYELSIEVLLKVLRSSSPRSNNKSDVERHIHAALTDAEAIKSIIKKQQNRTTANKSTRNISNNNDSSGSFRRNQQPNSPDSVDSSWSLMNALTSRIQNKTTQQQQPKSSNDQRKISRQRQEQQIAAMGADTRALLDNFYVPTSDLQQTSWDDVAGLDDVKRALQETAILPLIRPDLFTGLRKPQNILLYGPPGTGKTLLAKACATESGSALFVCSAGVLTSKWMGEAEKTIKSVFMLARHLAPAIIFLDEMDAVLSQRKGDGEHEASRRLKTEFMVQVEGVTGGAGGNSTSNGHVLVMACTNCPWDIDGAVLRRFPRRILVPLPDDAARKGLIEYLLRKAGKHSLTKRQISMLTKRTDGFSGSDIAALASEASFGPLRTLDMATIATVPTNNVRPIQYDDFGAVLDHTTRSITDSQLQKYADWQTQQAV